MTRQYRYVGPAEIAAHVQSDCGGAVIDSVEKLRDSLCSMDGYQSGESLTVTFVVGTDGNLRIADRRSEHVACAKGEDVLSAGEMTIGINPVTNEEVVARRRRIRTTYDLPMKNQYGEFVASIIPQPQTEGAS